MIIYFGIVGAACLAYYVIIALYTRKWNSTFAWFWAASGGIHLAGGLLWRILPWAGKVFLTAFFALAWLMAFFFLVCILSAAVGRRVQDRRDEKDAGYLIVLGAQIRGTRITNSLERRLRAALAYLEDHPLTKVIVSGGQGKGEAVPEADAMADWLLEKGIEGSRVLRERHSVSTEENLKFSRAFITAGDDRTLLVTNDFHVYRALYLGRKQGYPNLDAVAADSNPVLLLNYLAREIFALLLTKCRPML